MDFARAKHLVGLLRTEPGCPVCHAPVKTFALHPGLGKVGWYVMYKCGSSHDSRGELDQTPNCRRAVVNE